MQALFGRGWGALVGGRGGIIGVLAHLGYGILSFKGEIAIWELLIPLVKLIDKKNLDG